MRQIEYLWSMGWTFFHATVDQPFLLFPQVGNLAEWQRNKYFKTSLRMAMGVQPFTKQAQVLTTLEKRPFENNVGKEENAGN